MPFLNGGGLIRSKRIVNVADAIALLHYDGSFADARGHSVTNLGSPIIETTIKKFGTGSGSLDGSSGLQMVSSDFVFAGDFTFETQLRVDNFPATKRNLFATCTTQKAGAYGFNVNTNGTLNIDQFGYGQWYNSGTSIVDEQFHHIAFSRISGVIYIFVDGVSQGSVAISGTIGTSDGFTISGTTTFASPLSCYIDETLITNIGKYSSAFTPPTSPYS